jgi:hypothetical protein
MSATIERMHRARAKSNAGLLRTASFRFGTPIPLWHSRASICQLFVK